MNQDETSYAGRPRPRTHCVRWGPPALSPSKGHNPQFSAHICYGQMAAWIKMPPGMEVGVGPGDVVLDGDLAPHPQKGDGYPLPNFRARFCCGQTAGCIKTALGMDGGRPQPRRLCVRWGPRPLPKKGAEPSPQFSTMSVVAKRLDGSRCHLVRR